VYFLVFKVKLDTLCAKTITIDLSIHQIMVNLSSPVTAQILLA